MIMLKNKAQIARESIKNPETPAVRNFVARARDVRAWAHIILPPPPMHPNENPGSSPE